MLIIKSAAVPKVFVAIILSVIPVVAVSKLGALVISIPEIFHALSSLLYPLFAIFGAEDICEFQLILYNSVSEY